MMGIIMQDIALAILNTLHNAKQIQLGSDVK